MFDKGGLTSYRQNYTFMLATTLTNPIGSSQIHDDLSGLIGLLCRRLLDLLDDHISHLRCADAAAHVGDGLRAVGGSHLLDDLLYAALDNCSTFYSQEISRKTTHRFHDLYCFFCIFFRWAFAGIARANRIICKRIQKLRSDFQKYSGVRT